MLRTGDQAGQPEAQGSGVAGLRVPAVLALSLRWHCTAVARRVAAVGAPGRCGAPLFVFIRHVRTHSRSERNPHPSRLPSAAERCPNGAGPQSRAS